MTLDLDKLDEIVKVRIQIIVVSTVLVGLVLLLPYLGISTLSLFFGAAVAGIGALYVLIIYGLIRRSRV